MENLDDSVRDALEVDMVVDITTNGRKTGQGRRIEIWAHNLNGQVIITGSPGRRGWYANLAASPELTFHLKGDVKADLKAIARLVTDEAERRSILDKVKCMSAFEQRRNMDVEEYVRGSCLLEVSFK
jgi:deazaflavin-dependent oxidoreductase (nitroreductase family)